jgi:hypothetical protein
MHRKSSDHYLVMMNYVVSLEFSLVVTINVQVRRRPWTPINGKKELWVLDTLLYVEHIMVGKVLENWELCMLYTMEAIMASSSPAPSRMRRRGRTPPEQPWPPPHPHQAE